MDRIHLRDLRLRAIIGVYPEERRQKQDLVLNLELQVDLRQAGETDRIEDTVDYHLLQQRIIAQVEASTHALIEKLAAEIAQTCLDHPAVKAVRVILDKPGALRFARSVAVEIERP